MLHCVMHISSCFYFVVFVKLLFHPSHYFEKLLRTLTPIIFRSDFISLDLLTLTDT